MLFKAIREDKISEKVMIQRIAGQEKRKKSKVKRLDGWERTSQGDEG